MPGVWDLDQPSLVNLSSLLLRGSFGLRLVERRYTPCDVESLLVWSRVVGMAGGPALGQPADHKGRALWAGLGDDLVLIGQPADFQR